MGLAAVFTCGLLEDFASNANVAKFETISAADIAICF
jgi:hypothetical protein